MAFKRSFTLNDGRKMPRLGMGTWYLGQGLHPHDQELDALRTGLDAGISLIDTAEMYGDGAAESLVGEAISNRRREDLFIVSKVYPHNAGRPNIFKSVDATLSRLGTDYLDMYLLHWRGSIPLTETVECMEELVKEGKICGWGVSNFDTSDMKELWSIPQGNHCAVNQDLYHLGSRGVEWDLLPWMRQKNLPLMAYCPLAQAGRLRSGLLENEAVRKVASIHKISPTQVLLAFVLRDSNVVAIPRSASPQHVLENAAVKEVELTEEDLSLLNSAFPAPTKKIALDME
jgi:diketogulonate reductase-like aldo/keto reductase